MGEWGQKQKYTGFFTFFISGIAAISSGIIVSLLQEQVGFDYGMTGTLLSMMNIGNLTAGFLTGVLTGKIGMKRTVGILTAGYLAGYGIMAVSGWAAVLMLAFFLVGVAKGCTINTCTILVGDNSADRTKGMNLMHSCYALGALLCPFLISAAVLAGGRVPMAALSLAGGTLWLAFLLVPMGSSQGGRGRGTDWSFLKSPKFWLLTGLLFFQNAAETSVNGWMVTYFKGSGILSGALSAYTVTVMWGATLLGRLLIVFVIPLKKPEAAMIKMGVGCLIFYMLMMQAESQWPAILLLFAFSISMSGMNPTAVACAGRMTSVASMGVMLPAASSGAILMPWLIGVVADHAGLRAGMASNILACGGLLIFSIAVKRLSDREQG